MCYFGKGGFIHSEVYNMPIYFRKFYIRKLTEYIKKENDEIKKAQNKSSAPSSLARLPRMPNFKRT